MSGFAHRATETSRTAFGEIRPTASRPMSPYCGTRRMQEAEAAATQALCSDCARDRHSVGARSAGKVGFGSPGVQAKRRKAQKAS